VMLHVRFGREPMHLESRMAEAGCCCLILEPLLQTMSTCVVVAEDMRDDAVGCHTLADMDEADDELSSNLHLEAAALNTLDKDMRKEGVQMRAAASCVAGIALAPLPEKHALCTTY
jgi:hypothetical protein